MNTSLQMMCADIWKRGWRLFALGMISPIAIATVIATGSRIPTTLLYVAVVFWTYIPMFVLNSSQIALRLLPIDAQTIGRAVWVTTVGICASSLVAAVGVGSLIALAVH